MLSISSRSKSIFALVDCNNFFVSCERVFRPDLREKSVVVLSNNDGNIIARSNEAKALGIAMGDPYFKVESFLRRNNVTVFSSNYTLYGDMSHRVMAIIHRLEPEVEVYSIDEAFISMPMGKELALAEYGRALRTLVKRSTGIPVSIGFATTKTLAKIANRLAKKNPGYGGVFDMTTAAGIDGLLAKTDVGDIWGIGPQNRKKLNRKGISTALHLKNADDDWVRKQLTVTGLRTVWELRGIPCISLEEAPAPKKGIITSKSFGHSVVSHGELREAVATYMTRAAEKLRAQSSIANSLQVFIATNRFKPEVPQYANSLMVRLPEPTASTPVLIRHALRCLKEIYRAGYEYKKAGVMLTEIVPETHRQQNLFVQEPSDTGLMKALDHINRKWGSNAVQYACAGIEKTWTCKRVQLSQAYTTRWDQLPVVKASFPSVRR